MRGTRGTDPSAEVAEPIGSAMELTRALRLRYYRSAFPTETQPHNLADPQPLINNIRSYYNICLDRNWPMVMLRPEKGRDTWRVYVQHPPRKSLPGRAREIIDALHLDIMRDKHSLYKDLCVVYTVADGYTMIESLTLRAGEYMAFRMADELCKLMEENR